MSAMKVTTIDYASDTHEDVARAVLEAQNDGRDVILNLDDIPALRTDDIRRLITMLRQSRSNGSEFALRATRPDIRKTLSVTALDAVFTVVGSDAA